MNQKGGGFMTKTCAKCGNQTSDMANSCPQCGQQLTGESLNPGWIVAMQEKIKDARRSELFGLICGVIGFVLATVIFVPHLLLNMHWETMDWVEAIGFFILGLWGVTKNESSRKQKEKLINQLEKGE